MKRVKRDIFSMVNRGKKLRMLLRRSRRYDLLPITGLNALPLSYERLVGARTRGYSEKSASAPLQKSNVGPSSDTGLDALRPLSSRRLVGARV